MTRQLRPIVLAIAIAALLQVGDSAARAAGGVCTVSPDPVAIQTEYTISATGLTPGVWYVIHQHQAGSSAADRDDLVQADAVGNAAQTVTVPWGPLGVWEEGTVAVVWKRSSGSGYQTVGGPVASCGFTVTAG
jgi:hypothetical protein